MRYLSSAVTHLALVWAHWHFRNSISDVWFNSSLGVAPSSRSASRRCFSKHVHPVSDSIFTVIDWRFIKQQSHRYGRPYEAFWSDWLNRKLPVRPVEPLPLHRYLSWLAMLNVSRLASAARLTWLSPDCIQFLPCRLRCPELKWPFSKCVLAAHTSWVKFIQKLIKRNIYYCIFYEREIRHQTILALHQSDSPFRFVSGRVRAQSTNQVFSFNFWFLLAIGITNHMWDSGSF